MTDPIPAVVEAEATGEVAALFAELRTVLGVPFVNLIWRHLATIPGGLEWTWGLLRPLYESAALVEAAEGLAGGVVLPALAVDGFVLEAVGVDLAARAAIGALVADYNRANALNFLALSVACLVLRGEVSGSGVAGAPSLPARAVAGPEVGPAAPRLPGLEELSPALLALVRDFDQFGRIGPSAAVASLYRHLVHWPGFLAVAHTALLPLHRDGRLRAEQERLIGRSRAVVAERLVPLLVAVPGPLGDGARARVLAGLDEFTRVMIGRMVVMGRALHGVLPGG